MRIAVVLAVCSTLGSMGANAQSAPARAYTDAARRLQGESVPMTIPNGRQTLLTRLFGRRAA